MDKWPSLKIKSSLSVNVLLGNSELNPQKIFSSVSVLNTEDDEIAENTNDFGEEEEKILSARDRSHSLPSGKYSRHFRLLRYRNTFTRWRQFRNICKQCRHRLKWHPRLTIIQLNNMTMAIWTNEWMNEICILLVIKGFFWPRLEPLKNVWQMIHSFALEKHTIKIFGGQLMFGICF